MIVNIINNKKKAISKDITFLYKKGDCLQSPLFYFLGNLNELFNETILLNTK
mgnify:FL=1